MRTRDILLSNGLFIDKSLAKTIVSFVIHKMFVQGNKYIVSMKGYDVCVTIKREQTLQSTSTSLINIEFPYLFDESPSKAEVIKRECAACLNRLGEVVRFKTRLFVIERVFEHDIFLFNFDTVDSTGKKSTGSAFGFGGGPIFPINSIPEQNVEPELIQMLRNETEVPFYENLRLDSYYYFITGQFNNAVIIHNIILESIVADHLRGKLLKKGLSNEEADKTVDKIFSQKKGMHRVMSEGFEQIDGRSFRSSNLWEKFTLARTTRKNVIHPRTTRISKELALQTLQDIEEIIDWIHKP